jgi:Relaxase/Mobilisation nuclease domain
MPSRPVRFDAQPLLDISSYARRGPGRRDHLSPAEIDRVARTVRRTPEVMVKVLSRGGQDLKAVRRHLDYLRNREEGELAIQTDDGEQLTGPGVAKNLIEDWNLDLQEHRRRSDLDGRGRHSTKLVHKLMFSMPAGTPPQKVLEAVKNFAREEFALKHRYLMVLHTDEPHPHVHMVVRAVSEQGERLHIRKATLRGWRQEFARHLRALGVPANATERAVRGENRSPKLDGIYRAEQRGASWRTRAQVEQVGRELLRGKVNAERGKETLIETRKRVERGWSAASEILAAQGQKDLAAEVKRFVSRMPPPRSDREVIAEELRKQLRDARAREGPIR